MAEGKLDAKISTDIHKVIQGLFRRVERQIRDSFGPDGIYAPQRVEEWCSCGAAMSGGVCRFCDRLEKRG